MVTSEVCGGQRWKIKLCRSTNFFNNNFYYNDRRDIDELYDIKRDSRDALEFKSTGMFPVRGRDAVVAITERIHTHDNNLM